MKEHGNVLHKLDGQKGELVTTVVQAAFQFFKLISERQLTWLLKHKSQVIDAILNALCALVEAASQPDHAELRRELEKFYLDVMGITVDLSAVLIPMMPVKGDWWLIVVVPGVTYNQIIANLRTLFPVWVHIQDLDKAIDITKEQRRAVNEPYAVWVRATVEADPDNAGRSAIDLTGTLQITLMERLLLEGVYFRRTGKHLDVRTATLCAGSRSSDGGVQCTCWGCDVDRLVVSWYSPGYAYNFLRSRSVFC